MIVFVLIATRSETNRAALELNTAMLRDLPLLLVVAPSWRWTCPGATLETPVGLMPEPIDDRKAATYLAAGRSEALHGHCADAVSFWEQAVTVASTRSRLAHFELARGLVGLGLHAAAAGHFQEAGAAEYLNRLAQLQTDHPTEARELSELAYEVQPDLESAMNLASAYAKEGQIDRAVDVWQHLVATTPDDQTDHWLATAELMVLRQDLVGARAALEKALSITDDPYTVRLRLGRDLMQQGDWLASIEVYEAAAALKPASSSEPYSQAGLASARLGRYAEAMAWFDRAALQVPGDPWPMITAGEVPGLPVVQVSDEVRLQTTASLFRGT